MSSNDNPKLMNNKNSIGGFKDLEQIASSGVKPKLDGVFSTNQRVQRKRGDYKFKQPWTHSRIRCRKQDLELLKGLLQFHF